MLATGTDCSWLPGVCPSLGHPLWHPIQSPLARHLMHSSVEGVASLGQGMMAIMMR